MQHGHLVELARRGGARALLPCQSAAHCRSYTSAVIQTDEIVSQLPTIDSEDGSRTLRRRQHGQKPLPLPPILDPKPIARKTRDKVSKTDLPDDEKSDFQKKLEFNAYAQVLATPIRQCAITGARLPSHFLLPFRTAYSHASSQPASNSSKPHLSARLVPYFKTSRPDIQRQPSSNSSSYILNSLSLVQHLGPKNRWNSVVSPRMRERHSSLTGKSEGGIKIKSEWEWDAQMAETMLKGLRKEVARKLGVVFESGEWEESGLEEWCVKPGEGVEGEAAFWLAVSDQASTVAEGLRGSESREDPPVYSLGAVLGEQYEEVADAHALHWKSFIHTEGSRSGTIGLRSNARAPANLLKALIRLDAYLHHKPDS